MDYPVVIALLAGALSVLSPCILPIAPFVLGSAVQSSKASLLALIVGIALAFALVGAVATTALVALGFSSSVLRQVSGVLMIAVGAWSLFPAVKVMVTQASNGMVMATQSKASSITGKSPASYFAIGLLLGVAYSPCAGPALGFATSLALQGNNIGYSLVVMFLFAVGASLALAFIALTARRFIPTLARVFEKAQVIGGSLLIGYGLLVLAELDTVLIGLLLSIWPESLVNWSTLF